MIHANAAIPTHSFAEGEQVAVFRRTTVSPYSETAEDWYIAPADQASDGPVRPAWADTAGYTEQWTGWGLGAIQAKWHATRDLVVYEVATD